MARISRALPHLGAAEILEKIRTTENCRRQQKWWVVYNALVDPRTATEIAQHTGTSERLVHQVISDYNRKGVSAIETPGKGGRRSSYLSQDEEQAFLRELEPQAKRGQITTKAEVKQAFEQRVGKGVHKTTIYRLLQRHSWRKLKPRPQHPKADLDDLAHFQQTFEQQVRQIVHQREPADVRPVLIMATDEGRFGRTGEVRECWCPPRFRPTIAKQQVRQYLYAFTAVAPVLGKLCSLVLPFANTAMMNLFLAHVSLEFAQYFIILQLARARWHRAKHLQIPENIRLLPQPAYSPELMPVEHIWEEIREKHFYNRIFKSLDLVEETLCEALKNLMNAPQQVRSMTFFPHMRITL